MGMKIPIFIGGRSGDERDCGYDAQPDALSSLIAGGARFLTSLSEKLAPPEAGKPASPEEMGQRVVKAMGAVVARDESTGKSCLKIPLPEPDVLQGLISGLGQVLVQVMGKR